MNNNRIGIGVLGFLVVLVLAFFFLWRHEKGAHFDASLRADSAIAAADTSKLITDRKVQKVLGDSTQAWQRRVIQEKQRADELDKTLRLERRTKTDIGVTIDKGKGTASGVVTFAPASAVAPATDTRQAHFDVKAGVFDVAADVQLPAPPASGTMVATVTAPKIPLSLRLGCGPATDGVHRADAIVTGPRWATVGIDHVEADPAVCNPTMKLDSGHKVPLWVMIASDALSAAAGYWAGSKAQSITVVTK